ncbi:MAG TPA: hypothetical protein VIU39_16330 [Anaerolineales bacterium]
MSTLRKIFAAVFAALFVITAPLTLLLFHLERGAFALRTYQVALARQGFYERVPALLTDSLSAPLDALPFSIRGLGREERETLVSRILPPEISREMTDQALASVLGYLSSETDSAAVDMTPLKERISGEAGTQAVMDLVRAQPACSLAEIGNMANALLTGGQLSLCNPPQDFYPILVPVVQAQLQAIAAAVPAQITLVRADAASVQSGARSRIQLIRFAIRWSLIIPLGILLLMTALAVRSLRDWLLWWGGTFLPAGLIAALLGGAGAPVAGFLLLYFVTPRLSALVPSAIVESGRELAAAVAAELLSPVLMEGIGMAVFGLVLLALTFGLRKVRGQI